MRFAACRPFLSVLVVLPLLSASCSDDTDYVTSILRRPVDLAVTCRGADGSYLDVDRCSDDDARAVSWVLDADADGIFVSTLPDGSHYDFDPSIPGYSPIPVGKGLTRIVAAPDSTVLFVAGGSNEGGSPSISVVPADFYNLSGVSETISVPCPVRDMAVVRDASFASGYTLLAVLECESGSELWSFEPSSSGQGVGISLDRKLLSPLPGRVLWLTVHGTAAIMVARPADEAALRPLLSFWDGLIRIADVVGNPDVLQEVPVVNDSSFVPRGANEGVVPGCASASEGKSIPGYLSGRAAVSSDGSFIYVPVSVPAGVAVFDSELNRIDTHSGSATATGFERADQFFRRAGYLDIRADSPVSGVVFVPNSDEKGERAVAWQFGGEFIRIVANPADGVGYSHRVEDDPDVDPVESSAYMPILRYRGQDMVRGIVTRTDLPSFGGTAVVIPRTDDEKYLYYGIEFNGDVEAELPETWKVTYEGIVPGAEGGCGTLTNADDGTATFTVSGFDFCTAGVFGASTEVGGYAGDVLEASFPVEESCGEASGLVFEFRIVQVASGELRISALSAAAPIPTVSSDCGAGRLSWKVRASDSWIVDGSVSGFLHNQAASGDGTCVQRTDANAMFTGRAVTALPVDGTLGVDSCPIARGVDSRIDWESARFVNPAFNFWVVPGCAIGTDFKPTAIRPLRDTSLSFSVESGRFPIQNDIGGLAGGVMVVGNNIYAIDTSNSRVVVLDAESMSVESSWF